MDQKQISYKQVIDRFGFLEGIVNEANFLRIVDEACALAAAPKAAPGELHDHQILAITTAYEQGVGKGHQARKTGKEIANPYGTGYRCDLAWQYGYEEGKEQAERIAESANQPVLQAQGDAEDAGRYRWLRKYVGAERIGNITSVYLYIKQPQTNLSLLNETDSAIDAARHQLEGKQ